MTEKTPMNRTSQTNQNCGTDGRRSLFVDISFSKGVLNACIVGPRVGEREAPVIANAINTKLKQYGKKVSSLVLDFSEVQFISSLGLGMCIDVRNTAEQCEATTSIVGLTCNLNELFLMMRLDRLFTIEPNSAEYGSAA